MKDLQVQAIIGNIGVTLKYGVYLKSILKFLFQRMLSLITCTHIFGCSIAEAQDIIVYLLDMVDIFIAMQSMSP